MTGMARMLGRWRTSGCRPCTIPGPDCAGHERNTRWRKRVEARAFRREVNTQLRVDGSFDPLMDPSDCEHGCNGDCERAGSEVCTFLCHPSDPRVLVEQWAERAGFTDIDGEPDGRLVDEYLRRLWPLGQ